MRRHSHRLNCCETATQSTHSAQPRSRLHGLGASGGIFFLGPRPIFYLYFNFLLCFSWLSPQLSWLTFNSSGASGTSLCSAKFPDLRACRGRITSPKSRSDANPVLGCSRETPVLLTCFANLFVPFFLHYINVIYNLFDQYRTAAQGLGAREGCPEAVVYGLRIRVAAASGCKDYGAPGGRFGLDMEVVSRKRSPT